MSENSVTMADIANIVKGITAMADGIIREKAEKEMEEKISGEISTSRRIKIVGKVSAYVRKQVGPEKPLPTWFVNRKCKLRVCQVPELLMKIANEQIESFEEDEEEHRASQEIEDEIIEKIQPVVDRSIEKAIAEEKIDKLLRTPTEESKLGKSCSIKREVVHEFLYFLVCMGAWFHIHICRSQVVRASG